MTIILTAAMRANRSKPVKGRIKFAVVGDGECESWYIQMLKRNERSINVDLEPKIPQKKKLSDQFSKVVALGNDYDKVFWIVDFDVINAETRLARKGEKTALQEFKEYCNKIEAINRDAGEQKIVVIINNPCLEYWFLLHFEATSKYFSTCNDAAARLKRYLPDYEKTQAYYTRQNDDIYLKLRPKLPHAIENAHRLGAFDLQNPHLGMTQMHLFFSRVDDIVVG